MDCKMLLQLSKLRTDGGTQLRTVTDHDAIEQYAAAYRAGENLPALKVMEDKSSGKTVYWLYDGFHRLEAAKKAGRQDLECQVARGSLEDAITAAATMNQKHGVRRTLPCRRNAVDAMLRLHADWTDNAIAAHVGVDGKTVGGIRESLESTSEIPKLTKRVGKDGRTRDVSNIGAKSPAPDPVNFGIPKLTPAAETTTERTPEPEVAFTPDVPADEQEPAPAVAPNGNRPARRKQPDHPEPPPIQDGEGELVPDILRDIFADTCIHESLEAVERWPDALDAGAMVDRLKARHRFLVWLDYQGTVADLERIADAMESLAARLAAARPYAVCRTCAGLGTTGKGPCTQCRQSGYVPEWRLRELREGAA